VTPQLVIGLVGLAVTLAVILVLTAAEMIEIRMRGVGLYEGQ
jgi:hypothetical protein